MTRTPSSGLQPTSEAESPLSDTSIDYTRPGFDDDPAVLVLDHVDPHLGVDLKTIGDDPRVEEALHVPATMEVGA